MTGRRSHFSIFFLSLPLPSPTHPPTYSSPSLSHTPDKGADALTSSPRGEWYALEVGSLNEVRPSDPAESLGDGKAGGRAGGGKEREEE